MEPPPLATRAATSEIELMSESQLLLRAARVAKWGSRKSAHLGPNFSDIPRHAGRVRHRVNGAKPDT